MVLKETSLVIVGAGICGLSLAEKLRLEKKKSSLIIEKSKSVGGRMATRRQGVSIFDHGAQFYKAPPHREPFWHKTLEHQGLVRPWFMDQKRHFCYAVKNGMTGVAKSLAAKHEIIFDQKVIRIELQGAGVELIFESGDSVRTEKLVLTCPLPQSLALLRESQVPFDSALEAVTYCSALVGLFETSGNKQWVSGCQTWGGGDIYSISDNFQKGISLASALTVVMKPEFSQRHFDDPEESVLKLIQASLETEMPGDLEVLGRGLKKWRFSHAETPYPQPFYQLLTKAPIFLAGDGFGTSSILGAVRSAEAVAGVL